MLQTLGLIGSLVAGTFLILIGLTNLFAVVGIAKVFREMRTGDFDEAELERQLNSRGFLARLLGRVMRRVSKPWHLYPVGLLMGLGFDTATQVALLVLAAGTAAFTLPWYAILVLPVLFAAGMSLFDAADGIFMARAYGWAFLKPIRKVYYNLTVTVLSVFVALVIGVIVLVGLLVDRLGIESGPLAFIGSADLEFVGFTIVGLFVLVWLIALGGVALRADRRTLGVSGERVGAREVPELTGVARHPLLLVPEVQQVPTWSVVTGGLRRRRELKVDLRRRARARDDHRSRPASDHGPVDVSAHHDLDVGCAFDDGAKLGALEVPVLVEVRDAADERVVVKHDQRRLLGVLRERRAQPLQAGVVEVPVMKARHRGVQTDDAHRMVVDAVVQRSTAR